MARLSVARLSVAHAVTSVTPCLSVAAMEGGSQTVTETEPSPEAEGSARTTLAQQTAAYRQQQAAACGAAAAAQGVPNEEEEEPTEDESSSEEEEEMEEEEREEEAEWDDAEADAKQQDVLQKAAAAASMSALTAAANARTAAATKTSAAVRGQPITLRLGLEADRRLKNAEKLLEQTSLTPADRAAHDQDVRRGCGRQEGAGGSPQGCRGAQDCAGPPVRRSRARG